MKKFIILGLFGLLLISSFSLAQHHPDPEYERYSALNMNVQCNIAFTGPEDCSPCPPTPSLLDYAYGYGTTLGYSPAQLAQITDMNNTLDAHSTALWVYLDAGNYAAFMTRLSSTYTDLRTAKHMYRSTMKQYVKAEYSRIPEVISDYDGARSNYMACLGGCPR